MDLSLILARLKTELTGLRSIGVAADMDSAERGLVSTPCAFVLPLADAVTDMGLVGATGERTQEAFGVVHVMNNRRDAQGGAAIDDLHTLRTNLRNALVGWVPDMATGEAVGRAGGRLLNLDGNGRLWWIDEFQLTTYYWSA